MKRQRLLPEPAFLLEGGTNRKSLIAQTLEGSGRPFFIVAACFLHDG